MTRIPIACTLTADAAVDRVAEWRQFFADHVETVDRPSPTAAALRLRDGEKALFAAVDLAEREKTCCSFFTFAIGLREGRWLDVSVPEDAADILNDFVTLR